MQDTARQMRGDRPEQGPTVDAQAVYQPMNVALTRSSYHLSAGHCRLTKGKVRYGQISPRLQQTGRG